MAARRPFQMLSVTLWGRVGVVPLPFLSKAFEKHEVVITTVITHSSLAEEVDCWDRLIGQDFQAGLAWAGV